jgi:hypothetical protein
MQHDGDGNCRYYQESNQADGDPGGDSPQPSVPAWFRRESGIRGCRSAAQEITPIKAFLLILWSGGTGYVRPFFGGMAASGSVSLCTPLAKML